MRSLVVLVLMGLTIARAYWPAEADPLREGGRQADVMDELGLEHYFGRDAKRRLWELEALGPLIEVYSMR